LGLNASVIMPAEQPAAILVADVAGADAERTLSRIRGLIGAPR
jgi:hypothetical protein